MVMEIAADPGEIGDHLDAVLFQLGARPDPGPQQDGGGVERARAEHHPVGRG